LYGNGIFTYNVEIHKQKHGFEWEILVPKQTITVSGIVLNWVTDEEVEFNEVVEIDPAVQKVKIVGRDNIGSEGFFVEDIVVMSDLISLKMGA